MERTIATSLVSYQSLLERLAQELREGGAGDEECHSLVRRRTDNEKSHGGDDEVRDKNALAWVHVVPALISTESSYSQFNGTVHCTD